MYPKDFKDQDEVIRFINLNKEVSKIKNFKIKYEKFNWNLNN